MAIYEVVCRVESTLKCKEVMLGVLLDIKGVFDNNSIEFINRVIENILPSADTLPTC